MTTTSCSKSEGPLHLVSSCVEWQRISSRNQIVKLNIPEQLPRHGVAFLGLIIINNKERSMISRFALVIAAVAGICSAMPAGAEEIGIGVGPGGVTIGSGHGDRYRDRDRAVIINRDRDRDGDRDRTVIINKDRDHRGDRDRDGRAVVIDRN
jgi:hypothetical protein